MLEEEYPEAASLLHQLITKLLLERVSQLTRTIDALER